MVRGMFADTLEWGIQELGVVALASALLWPLPFLNVSKRYRHPEIANCGAGSWNSRLNMDRIFQLYLKNRVLTRLMEM